MLCLGSRSALQPIIFNIVQSIVYVVLVRAAREFRAATPLLACCDLTMLLKVESLYRTTQTPL